MEQKKTRKIRTGIFVPEDLYTKFKVIASAKYGKKGAIQQAFCDALQMYIEENKEILKRLLE